MTSLIIFSKKHGNKTVLFDECDFDLIKKFTWTLNRVRGCFYAVAWLYESGNKPKLIKMHRLVLGFPDYSIDHIDRNGLNNRKSNLRKFSGGQNKMNSGVPKNNSSGFKGVTLDKKKNLWVTHIGFNGVTIKGGRFKNKYLAALKYNELALRYFGEFASLNILTDEEILKSKDREGRRLSNRNDTGYRGVFTYGVKFVSRISYNKKITHIGYFDTALKAARAYNEYILKHNLPKEKLNIL